MAINPDEVWAMLRRVNDPEVGLNIVDLGLVYDVAVTDDEVVIEMTLTTQGCPISGTLPRAVERAVALVVGVGDVNVKLVWEPAWSPDHISAAGRKQLGWMN